MRDANPSETVSDRAALFVAGKTVVPATRDHRGVVRQIDNPRRTPSNRALSRAWSHPAPVDEAPREEVFLAGIFHSVETAMLAYPIVAHPSSHLVSTRWKDAQQFVERTQSSARFTGLENLVTRSGIEVLEGMAAEVDRSLWPSLPDQCTREEFKRGLLSHLYGGAVREDEDSAWSPLYGEWEASYLSLLSGLSLVSYLVSNISWQGWRSDHHGLLLSLAYLSEAAQSDDWRTTHLPTTIRSLVESIPRAIDAVMHWNHLTGRGYPSEWAAKGVRNKTGLSLSAHNVCALDEMRSRPRVFVAQTSPWIPNLYRKSPPGLDTSLLDGLPMRSFTLRNTSTGEQAVPWTPLRRRRA